MAKGAQGGKIQVDIYRNFLQYWLIFPSIFVLSNIVEHCLINHLALGFGSSCNIGDIIIVNILFALVALAFGLLLSTLAKSEFQMMQFIPLIITPQLFFSGIIPLDSMTGWV